MDATIQNSTEPLLASRSARLPDVMSWDRTRFEVLDRVLLSLLPSVVAGSVDATLSLEPVGSIASANNQAKRAVIKAPDFSGASITNTARHKPATMRLRAGKFFLSGTVPHSYSVKIKPLFAISAIKSLFL